MINGDRCRLFYEHWDSLRSDNPYPSLADFLDAPNVTIAPYTFVVDRVGNDLVTRLFGTGLVEARGADLTGQNYALSKSVSIARAIVSNVTLVTVRPCGLRAVDIFSSTKGKQYLSEVVVLPLGEPGNSYQAAGINDVRGTLSYDETINGWRGAKEIEWIDIGYGVPDKAPLSR